MSSPGRLIGLDLGSQRIGVAVSDGDQRLATPVTAIQRSGDRRRDHQVIHSFVRDYEAVAVVVGLPLSLSGQVGPAADGVLDEVEQLRQALPVAVHTVDERFTTRQAALALTAGGRSTRRQRDVIDQTAAAVLLQAFMDGGRAAS